MCGAVVTNFCKNDQKKCLNWSNLVISSNFQKTITITILAVRKIPHILWVRTCGCPKNVSRVKSRLDRGSSAVPRQFVRQNGQNHSFCWLKSAKNNVCVLCPSIKLAMWLREVFAHLVATMRATAGAFAV